MGLSFSKSVRVGAVRFNFSGSGIGMSVGIPGLRIGTGPRGAYIAGGVGGFRYRRSLNTPRRSNPVPQQVFTPDPRPVESGPSPVVLSTQEHDTLGVLELSDSDSDALLKSINEQRQKTPLWPFFAGFLFLLYFPLTSLLMKNWPGITHFVLVLLMAGAVAWVHWRDKMRRLTVLFFEPDAVTSNQFEALTSALSVAAAIHKVRAVISTSRYADRKYSAGASEGLKFSPATLQLGQAPGVVANVDVPMMKTGRTTLAFYPDRILTFQGSHIGAVSYAALSASEERTLLAPTGN